MSRKPIKTFFGSTAMFRAYCSECGDYALVVGGKLQCCDRTAPEAEKYKKHRETTGCGKRRGLSRTKKNTILVAQHNKCIYCKAEFGTDVWDNKKCKYIRVKPEFDHLVPWCYSEDDGAENVAAACRECNAVKGCLIFKSVDEAQVYILNKRGLL